jgi:hypothetical protein
MKLSSSALYIVLCHCINSRLLSSIPDYCQLNHRYIRVDIYHSDAGAESRPKVRESSLFTRRWIGSRSGLSESHVTFTTLLPPTLAVLIHTASLHPFTGSSHLTALSDHARHKDKSIAIIPSIHDATDSSQHARLQRYIHRQHSATSLPVLAQLCMPMQRHQDKRTILTCHTLVLTTLCMLTLVKGMAYLSSSFMITRQ